MAGKSAHRHPAISYKSYLYDAALAVDTASEIFTTPVDESRRFEGATLPAATAWPSLEYMQQRFQEMRDQRFIQHSSKPNFLRRISWLYPDDGCFARAQLANRNLLNASAPAPSKVYVFGDLSVQTVNSPYGSVTWWYHVAPVVEVNGQKYVLDPSIEPRNPLTLQVWLAKMNPNPGTLSVAICGSGSYHPYDKCDREVNGQDKQSEMEQGWFLDPEWDRLVDLNRDPERELGNFPPWL